MNKEERRMFIFDLIENIKADMLKENEKYPDNWDGLELRQRLLDITAHYNLYKNLKHYGMGRYKDYKNFCIVEGLIWNKKRNTFL